MVNINSGVYSEISIRSHNSVLMKGIEKIRLGWCVRRYYAVIEIGLSKHCNLAFEYKKKNQKIVSGR